MSFDFHLELTRIWENAVSLYKAGHTDAASFPLEDDLPLLATWGLSKIDLFDYAEDWCIHQEPDFHTFLLVHYERWFYFSEVQNCKPSSVLLVSSSLPAKTDRAKGVVWLPRIIPKARAKLRGELSNDVMYGCGGDRQFFKDNNIHPAEFLRVVRRLNNDDQAIIQWVFDRLHRDDSTC